MKLISMTDFVLEQEQPTYLDKEEFEDVFYKIHNYANFLKKPLELGMFVPCDENGDILRDGVNWNKKFYQKAQERVLFEGFKVKGDFWLSNGELYIDEEFCENKTIEDLIDFDVTLTLTALKQLGL